MPKRREVRAVPELKGWLTAVGAAKELGISRQSVARMMAEGVFRTQRAVGERPLYIVRVEEVRAYRAAYHDEGSWAKAAEALRKMAARKIGADKA